MTQKHAKTCTSPDVDVLGDHDHKDCVDAVEHAIQDATELNLTPARRQVLDVLLESHHALGAYAILERLHAQGTAFQPPIVYRALDYLLDQELVHRIEKINAFVACSAPSHSHAPGFIVCESCNLVAEHHLTTPPDQIAKPALDSGFQINSVISEVFGLCAKCAAEASK